MASDIDYALMAANAYGNSQLVRDPQNTQG